MDSALHILPDYYKKFFSEGFTLPVLISSFAFVLSIGSFYISAVSLKVNRYKLRQDVLKAIIDNLGNKEVRDIRGSLLGLGGLSDSDQEELCRDIPINRNGSKITIEDILLLLVSYDRLAYQFGDSKLYLTEICLLQIDIIPILQRSTTKIISHKRSHSVRKQPLYIHNLPLIFSFYNKNFDTINAEAIRRMSGTQNRSPLRAIAGSFMSFWRW